MAATCVRVIGVPWLYPASDRPRPRISTTSIGTALPDRCCCIVLANRAKNGACRGRAVASPINPRACDTDVRRPCCGRAGTPAATQKKIGHPVGQPIEPGEPFATQPYSAASSAARRRRRTGALSPSPPGPPMARSSAALAFSLAMRSSRLAAMLRSSRR